MKQLSNAIVFKATLPSIESMAEKLVLLEHKEIGSQAFACSGFVSNELTGEMVNEFVGGKGFTFQLRVDQKVLPAAVIKREVDIRAEKIEKEFNRPVPKKQKAEIKSEVLFELLPSALVKTTIVNIYYDINSKYLVVDTTRKAFADMVLAMLIKCCDTVKTETIHVNSVKLGVTAKVQSFLESDDTEAFEGFDLGHYCRLVKRGTKQKSTYENADLVSMGEQIVSEIKEGFEVDNITLVRNETEFKLTNDFHFKSISFDGFALTEDCKDDKAYAFRYEASVKILMLVDVIDASCAMVGYREDSEEQDELYDSVVAFVKEERLGSVTAIQRKFKLGYNRASRIVEMMEANGVVSAPAHNGHREVLI
jgi:recombination associated protein RdgC